MDLKKIIYIIIFLSCLFICVFGYNINKKNNLNNKTAMNKKEIKETKDFCISNCLFPVPIYNEKTKKIIKIKCHYLEKAFYMVDYGYFRSTYNTLPERCKDTSFLDKIKK